MLSRALALCLLLGLAAGATPEVCEAGRCAPGGEDGDDDVGLMHLRQTGPLAPKGPVSAIQDSEAADEKAADEAEDEAEDEGEDEAEDEGEDALQGKKYKVARFGTGVRGKLKIKKGSKYVEWRNNRIKVPNRLISQVCGRVTDPHSIDFMYHIHDFWTGRRPNAVADGCGASFTGGHWDPTAACGGASGNPVCVTCGTKGVNYTCNKDTFERDSVLQYRFLSPNAQGSGGSTCEFGDLSGMYGNLPGSQGRGRTIIRSSGYKDAKMTTTYGSITEETVVDCQYGNLINNFVEKSTPFALASTSEPLDELDGKSIVFHCGNGFENPGARLFCAKLH